MKSLYLKGKADFPETASFARGDQSFDIKFRTYGEQCQTPVISSR